MERLDTACMTTTSACSNNITIRSLIYQGDYADFKSAVYTILLATFFETST
jgi:hypothetical protein